MVKIAEVGCCSGGVKERDQALFFRIIIVFIDGDAFDKSFIGAIKDIECVARNDGIGGICEHSIGEARGSLVNWLQGLEIKDIE